MVSPLSDRVIACLPELHGSAKQPNYAVLKSLAAQGDEGALEVLVNLAARKGAVGKRAAEALAALHREVSGQAQNPAQDAPRLRQNVGLRDRLRQSIESLAYHMTAIGMRNPGLATARPLLRDLGQEHARRCIAAPQHPHTANIAPPDFSLEAKDISACFGKRALKSISSLHILYAGASMGPKMTSELDTQLERITRTLKVENDRACAFVNDGRHWMLFIFECGRDGKIKLHGFDSAAAADREPERLRKIGQHLERGLGERFGGAELSYASMQDHTGNTCGLLCIDMAYRVDAGLRDAPGSGVGEHMRRGIDRWNAVSSDVQLAYAYERYGEITRGSREV